MLHKIMVVFGEPYKKIVRKLAIAYQLMKTILFVILKM